MYTHNQIDETKHIRHWKNDQQHRLVNALRFVSILNLPQNKQTVLN